MDAEVSQKAPEVSCEAAGEDHPAETDQALLTDGESTSTQPPAVSNGEESDEGKEMVEVKIIWNKNKYDLKIPLDGTGANLKEKIHSLTGNAATSVLLWSIANCTFLHNNYINVNVILKP